MFYGSVGRVGLRSSIAPFSPAALFAAGEQGGWYDPSDIERYTVTTGPELVTNGTFNTGITGWTDGSSAGGSISWNPAGYMDLVNTTGAPIARQQVNVTSGRWYRFRISNVTSPANLPIQFYVGSTSNGSDLIGLTSVSPYSSATVDFFANSSAAHITVRQTNVGTASVDNISILELTAIGTATMFQDGYGTIPVTAVEQPVGLIYDKSRGATAGPELVTNGDFSNGSTGWTLGTGWSVSSGVASVLATGATTDLSASLNTVTNRLYIIRITISNYVSGSVTPRFAGVANSIGQNFPASNGTFYQQLVSTADNTIFVLRANGTANFSVDDISIKEVPGNHLFQFTPGAAPVLSARVNILEKTENFSDAYWTKSRSSVTPESIAPPTGANTVWRFADNSTLVSNSRFFTNVGPSAVVDRNYKFSFYLKSGTLTQVFARRPGFISDTVGVYFDASTGTTTNVGGITTSSMTPVGDDWWYCQAIMSAASTAATPVISLSLNETTVFQLTVGTQYVFITGVDMREATLSSSLPPYQYVDTSTNYQTSGFPYYLKFDGIDDFLVTTTITPGVDEVQAFTGMRKLSDVTRAIIVESSTTTSNNGTFSIEAPSVAGQPRFSFFTRGTASVGPGVNNAIYAAPTTRVVTGIGDISAPNAAIYMDKTLGLQSSLTQGTGNYLAYPVYVGARAGNSFFFGGNIYSLIFRFGANLNPDTISNAQDWVNQRTFAY